MDEALASIISGKDMFTGFLARCVSHIIVEELARLPPSPLTSYIFSPTQLHSG
jgi:hypothetical protein